MFRKLSRLEVIPSEAEAAERSRHHVIQTHCKLRHLLHFISIIHIFSLHYVYNRPNH
jgi:hypothetical protein